jgi:hypothetical protein
VTIWNKFYPAITGTSVSGSVAPDPNSQIRANWLFIQEWWGVEHTTFTSAGSGEHTAGKVGSVLVDTAANIAALTSPGTGALAYNTTVGQLQIYDGLWVGISCSAYSRMRYMFGSQVVTGSIWTAMGSAGAGSGTYNTLAEFSDTTFRFTAVEAGYYLVRGLILFPTDTNNYNKGVAISQNASLVSKMTRYGSTILNLFVVDVLPLNIGDYIQLAAYHDYTSPITISSGILQVIRLS